MPYPTKVTRTYVLDITSVYPAIKNITQHAVHHLCHNHGCHVRSEPELFSMETTLVTYAVCKMIKDQTSVDAIANGYDSMWRNCNGEINDLWRLLSDLVQDRLFSFYSVHDVFVQTVLTKTSLYIFVHM